MKSSKRSINMSVNFPIYKGTLLAFRYKVQAFLGEGSFGKVAKCVDTATYKKVAIKIIKDNPILKERAKEEIIILQQLKTLSRDKRHLVRWDGWFFHQTFICLQFELLDMSLFDYMQQRKFWPLSMAEIHPLVYQLNTALLHLEDLKIIHADIKPDNIMIVDHRQQPLQVKIIDFGLAHHVSDVALGTFVQSLWYRAPEVLLGLAFSEQIDMWSLGLIAAELSLGYPAFPAVNDYELMKFIVDTLGQPPDDQLERGLFSTCFFNFDDSFTQWRMKTPAKFPPLYEYKSKDTRGFYSLQHLKTKLYYRNTAIRNEAQRFVDLLQNMLEVDKTRRIKPRQVLEHPFFSVLERPFFSVLERPFFSVLEQGDSRQNTNLTNAMVNNTEEPNVTQQPPSLGDSTEPLIVDNGKTVSVSGRENVCEKMEVKEAVKVSRKKNFGLNMNLFKRIQKCLCSS